MMSGRFAGSSYSALKSCSDMRGGSSPVGSVGMDVLTGWGVLEGGGGRGVSVGIGSGVLVGAGVGGTGIPVDEQPASAIKSTAATTKATRYKRAKASHEISNIRIVALL